MSGCALSNTTISEARLIARRMLSGATETARLDADVLIASACGVQRDMLHIDTATRISALQAQRLGDLLRRRKHGEPVAYLTSVKEFWSIAMRAAPSALIPRPETELLVERIVERCVGTDAPRIADLGTGSGAVALAVASEVPNAQVIATDLCEDALRLAEDNRSALECDRVHFVACRWSTALGETCFDVIGANPPYIREDDPCLESATLSYEPRIALVGGADGLECITQIAETAHRHMNDSGWLVLEHGWDQGDGVRRLMKSCGYANVHTLRDLSGNERVTEGQWYAVGS